MPFPPCTITFEESLLFLDADKKKDLRDGLSASAVIEKTLFLASDEATRIERLIGDSASGFAGHEIFPLKTLIGPLPDTNDEEEVDIEGFAIDRGCLWVVGSHSGKRKKIDLKKDGTLKGTVAENIARIAVPETEGNRYLLARIPLEVDAEGVATPVPPADPSRATRRLPATKTGGAIITAVVGDPHLGRFLPIPGKDNGLDIEGLAVSGDRVYIGLRGPVLRGWAIILELQVKVEADENLSLVKQADGASVIKHFVDLDGLGVRDLAVEGTHLLVLAGPTMVLDAPEILYRWRDALAIHEPSLTWNTDLELVAEFPPVPVPRAGRRRGGATSFDHAEGIALMPDGRSLLVFHDAPGETHKPKDGSTLKADVVQLS